MEVVGPLPPPGRPAAVFEAHAMPEAHGRGTAVEHVVQKQVLDVYVGRQVAVEYGVDDFFPFQAKLRQPSAEVFAKGHRLRSRLGLKRDILVCGRLDHPRARANVRTLSSQLVI